MPVEKFASKVLKGKWLRVIAGAVAVAILVPVPAFAIKFLGSWDIFQSQFGDAPPMGVATGDTSTGGFVILNPGSATGARNAASRITLIRNFNVASGGETFKLTSELATLLQNAFLRASIRIDKIDTPDITHFSVRPKA